MTATNHALTGAIIGLMVSDPFIAAPVALLSHFVLDSIPHHGSLKNKNVWLKSRTFHTMLIVDASLCLVLVIALAILHPRHWILACVCAFLAASPDLASIGLFRAALANKSRKPNLYTRFASKIQWFERPSGTVVEATWFLSCLFILSRIIRF
jgi:hypothetical protein